MPDEQLARPAGLDDRGGRVARLTGRERVPDFSSGVFVERICHSLFSADNTDELLAVYQRMPAKAPLGSLRFEIALEIFRPQDVSMGRIQAEEVSLGAQRIGLSLMDSWRAARA